MYGEGFAETASMTAADEDGDAYGSLGGFAIPSAGLRDRRPMEAFESWESRPWPEAHPRAPLWLPTRPSAGTSIARLVSELGDMRGDRDRTPNTATAE